MIIIIGCACMVAMLMIIYFISRERKPSGPPEQQRQPPQRVHEGAARRAQMIRNRGARLRANAQAHDSDDENAADEEPELEAENLKIGAKKRAKLEAKAEKKAHREAEEIARQDKKKRAEQADDERRRAEEKQLAEDRRRDDAERKEREEKERHEHEEYLKMKEAFSVEEEGYEDGEPDDEQNLLQEFVSYVKTQKVVIVEDLAAHFKLKTQAVIDRLRDLQNDNILTGVLDDRGKFIYVSQEEMEAVAKFIKQRGRVSIQELAENSNQLINLTPVIKTSN